MYYTDFPLWLFGICYDASLVSFLCHILITLAGFTCWALGKKELGNMLVRHGAICGAIAISLYLVAVALTALENNSLIPLVILVDGWLIVILLIKVPRKIRKSRV